VPLTLLAVDDHSSLRRLIEVVAGEDERYGLVVSAAGTAEAVALAAEHQPDAVLLDVGLGHEDGLAAVALLRAATPGVVVVVFSSHPSADHDSARQAGADLFVPKGTDPDLLLDLVAQQVEARRQRTDRTRLIDLGPTEPQPSVARP
jgi:DNA-binding NarL/FixJ family response regulator